MSQAGRNQKRSALAARSVTNSLRAGVRYDFLGLVRLMLSFETAYEHLGLCGPIVCVFGVWLQAAGILPTLRWTVFESMWLQLRSMLSARRTQRGEESCGYPTPERL